MKYTNNDELFLKYQQTQDIRVRNKIVENNLQYVKQVANFYYRKSNYKAQYNKELFDDLFQVGVIGLIKAVESYDLSKKIKFTPFALPKIRGEILHWLRDKGHLIRIPSTLQELHQKVKKHSQKNKITYEKAAIALGLDKKTAVELSEIYLQNYNPILEDIEAVSYADIVDIRILEIFSILPYEHRLVISCRMLQEMTIKDTAMVLGLKLNQVKDLEKDSIKLLQKEYCEQNSR